MPAIGNGIYIGRSTGRGAAPVTPLTILGGDLLAWWRADLGITLNGSNVSAWADQSGNGHDLSQGTATNQPLFEAAGLGGQPSVLFDGVDNFMAANTLGAPLSGTDQPLSVIAAYHLVSAAANDVWFSLTHSVDADALFRVIQTANPYLHINKGDNAGGFVTANNNTTILDTTVPHVFSLVHPGTTVSTWYDGTVAENGAGLNVGLADFNRFSLGCYGISTFFSNIRYAEIVVTATNLSTALRNAVEDYMQARYGTP